MLWLWVVIHLIDLIDAYLFLFLMLQNFIVRRTRTSCFYLLPLPLLLSYCAIFFIYFTDVFVRHIFHLVVLCDLVHYVFSVFISSVSCICNWNHEGRHEQARRYPYLKHRNYIIIWHEGLRHGPPPLIYRHIAVIHAFGEINCLNLNLNFLFFRIFAKIDIFHWSEFLGSM